MTLTKKISYVWMLELFLLLLVVTPMSMIFVAETTFMPTTVLLRGKKPIKTVAPKLTTLLFVNYVPPDDFKTTTVLPKGKKPIKSTTTTPPAGIEPDIPFTVFVTTAPPRIEPAIPFTAFATTAPPRIEPAIPFTVFVTTAPPRIEPDIPFTVFVTTAPPRIEPAIPFTAFVTTAPPRIEPAIPFTVFKTTSPPGIEPAIPFTVVETSSPPGIEPIIPFTDPVTTAAPTTLSTLPPGIEPAIPFTASSKTEPTTTLSNPISVPSSEPTIAKLKTPTSMALNTSTSAIISAFKSMTSTKAPGLQHHQLGALLETVLSDYNPRLRPRNDQFRFVAIFSDFVPVSLIEFNTQEQKFSVMGYFKLDWRDDFLTWKPSMYEGMKNVRIPTQSIWIPKLSIDKAYDGNGLVGDMYSDIALINYRGYVRWFPEGTYSVVCAVTIRFYPFDIQTCTLTYYIADEDNSTINFKHDGEVDLSEYIENAEWKLITLTAERKLVNNVYVVHFHFNVERRGGFAMFTLVVPVLLLAMLSGATFLIPIESGEKCSFSVTIFLAYGIFETVVIDTLPPNSLDISYFIIYLTSLLTISVLLTFYTILQAKIVETMGGKVFKCLSGTNSGSLTWGLFLQKLDTYVFVLFLVLVVGFTSIFLAVMSEKFDVM